MKKSLLIALISLAACTTNQTQSSPQGSMAPIATQPTHSALPKKPQAQNAVSSLQPHKQKKIIWGTQQNFICKDGTKFSIAFSKHNKKAQLALQKGETELLTEHLIGSGIEYGNAAYLYRQYNLKTTLTRTGRKTTRCVK